MRRMLPGALSSSVSRKSRRLRAGFFCDLVIPIPQPLRPGSAADDLVEHPVVEGMAQRLHVREFARETDRQAQALLLPLDRLVVLGDNGVDAAVVVGRFFREVGARGLL